MTVKRLIYPLLYKSVTTFRGPLWSIADGITLNTIFDEDFGPIYSCEREDCRTIISQKTKCLYVLDPDESDPLLFAKRTATKLKFVMNIFSSGMGVILPFGFITHTARKTRLIKTLELEAITNLHLIRESSYRLNAKFDKDAIRQYYNLLTKACASNPSLYFTLERFCSSSTRSESNDRIVDVTIALESLIPGKDELRYKFSLYNAFIAKTDCDERSTAFNIFRDLYDARSKIVHGDIDSKDAKKSIGQTVENWEEVTRLARAAITYYILYLSDHTKADWENHIKDLVFATTTRIV